MLERFQFWIWLFSWSLVIVPGNISGQPLPADMLSGTYDVFIKGSQQYGPSKASDETPNLYSDTILKVRYLPDGIFRDSILELHYYDCKQRLTKLERKVKGRNDARWHSDYTEIYLYSDFGRRTEYFKCVEGYGPGQGIIPGTVNQIRELTIRNEEFRIVSKETKEFHIESDGYSADSIIIIRTHNYEYNEDGTLSSMIAIYKQSNMQSGWKYIYTYYEQDDSELLFQSWDDDLKDWSNLQIVKSFRSGIMTDSTHEYHWDDDLKEWIDFEHTTYIWHDWDMPNEVLVIRLLTETGSWVYFSREKYQYYPDGKKKSYLKERWSQEKGEWEFYEKTDYEYNQAGEVEVVISTVYRWNNNDGVWDNLYRLTNTSNMHGYLIQQKSEHYDSGWILSGEYFRTLVTAEQVNTAYELFIPDVELCMVTVSNTGRNVLIWEKNVDPGVVSYNLYRESTRAGYFDLIGSVMRDNYSVFIDQISDPHIKSYVYKVTASDECYESSGETTYSTLHLQVTPAINAYNMNWGYAAGNADNNVETYHILRGRSPYALEVIDSVSASSASYTDINPPQDTLYYQIAGVISSACTPTGALKSLTESYDRILSNKEELKEHISIIGTSHAPSFRLYPNPVSDKLYIQFNNGAAGSEKFICSIYTLTGQKVLEVEDNNVEAVTIDTRQLDEGLYIIEITFDNLKRTDKLIKL